MAGVVFVSKFIEANKEDSNFENYLDYLSRDDAQKNDFGNYQDYMSDEVKTTSLFDFWGDLTDYQKNKYKTTFKESQKKGGVLWQHVLSFDDDFLKDNNIMDAFRNIDEKKIKSVTKIAMQKLIQKEGMRFNNIAWTAAIHYNTKNIHVHIAAVEKEPTLEHTKKAMISKKSISAFKSAVVNNIVDRSHENTLITNLIRNNITQDIKESINTKEIIKKFDVTFSQMQNTYNKNYKNLNEKDKETVDNLSKFLISQSKSSKKLEEMLNSETRNYTKIYGNQFEGSTFSKNKLDFLYNRIGNKIIQEMNLLHKTKNQKIKNETFNSKMLKKQQSFQKALAKNKEKQKIKKFLFVNGYRLAHELNDAKEKAFYEYEQRELTNSHSYDF